MTPASTCRGARIALASEVPVGSGLSSSAALESAVLTALVDLGGLDLPVERRPALAQRAENVYVGAPTGILDQSASIRCREGQALFLDCRTLRRSSRSRSTWPPPAWPSW